MTMDQVLAAFKEGKLTSEEVLQYAEKEKKLRSKYPLSEGQKGLWFLAKMAPSSSVYNVPMTFPVYEGLECERFESACRYVAKKYPILTIKMEEEVGVPYQKYQEPKSVKPSFEDVSLLTADELQTLITERAKQPFDLLTGPLIRISVFSKAPEVNILLIVVHHIVFDAASMPILLDALFSAYGASLNEFSDMGPSGALNYFNFVKWEKSYLDSQVGKKSRNYWNDHLKGELPVLELPMERKSTLETPVAGATYSMTLSVTESAGILKFCLNYGINLSVFFLCAYQILLARYSGNPDVIVGMPAMGRTKAEFDLMIGYFVNMMPLRVSVDNEKILENFLKEVQGILADGIDHSSYPFPKLVSELNVSRESNVSAVFQVAFSYQARNLLQTDGQSNSGSKSVVENINEIQQEGEFKLVLEVREQYDTFLLKFKYDTNVLGIDDVKKISSHYMTLIHSFLSNANHEIGSYKILSPSEKKCLLEDWTDTHQDLGPIDTLHGLFEEQVACVPDNVAVIEQHKTLTYDELNNQARSIARHLLDRGVQREELVGIIIEKGCNQVAAVMGVLMSGAACLPMDLTWPHNRQKEVVTAANCKIILVAGERNDTSEWQNVDVIEVDKVAVLEKENLKAPELPEVKAEDLAYVIFTSGSTGKPKGVMIQHGCVVNTIKDINQRFGIDSRDSVLAISALSFDLSFYDIFGLLGAGGSVVFPSKEDRIDPSAWLELVENYGVTIWNTVPSMLQMFVDHLEQLNGLRLNIKLRRVLLSGDWIPVNLPAKAKRMMPNLSIISLGGATEASIWSNYYPIDNVNINLRSVPYGKPLANQRFYILDDLLNLCPIGVVGNLYIAGEGLAKGYFGDSALTESSFITHDELKQRLYKTGDLGRWMTNGNMELLGRIDHQIKLRGFRIELGEIESKLLGHERVHSCAVTLAGKSKDDKKLVAYLVNELDKDKQYSDLIDEVSEYLKSQLPDYMQPSAYMLLDQLPLTANGKIDRGALPEIKAGASLNVAYVPPQNDVEATLVDLWGELLGTEPGKISSEANFFALGGHSLLAMRLISKLQEAGYSTDLRTIFKAETLAVLASEIDEVYEDEDYFDMDLEEIPVGCKKIEPHMLTLVPWIENDDIDAIIKQTPSGISNIQDIYSLAPRQEGILIHHLMARDEDPYVLAALVEAKSEEILEKYLSALQTLVIRHDVLRTAVITKGLSAPVQVVHRNARLNIEDLTHLVDKGNETLLDFMEQRLKQSRRTMDVSKPPLLRVELVRGGKSNASYLLLRWHHLIADHEGLGIIEAEVRAILNGQEKMLPPAASSRYFIAHAIYRNDELDSETYFTDLLGDITEPTYPFNLDDVRVESSQISVIRNELSTGLSLKIRRIAQQFRTSPAMLFHAAWALVVARCSGRDDVVFGTVLSGRFQGIKRSGSMLGMFINTLPLRLSLEGKSVQDIILDADKALIELMEYEQASLSMAQKCSGLEFGIPLFSALINYRHTFSAQNAKDEEQQDFGVNVIGFQERTNYPFVISIDDLGEDFSLELQIHQSISAERVIGYIEQAISGITEALESNPNQMLSNLSILTESEKHTLLIDWNNTDANFNNDKCLHELFTETARRYPEKKALVFKNDFITYQELENRSNQLANCLIARGVLPDTLIGLCVDRSLEMVIGMLGVLKAGAAYVPLDPNYPQSRIEFVLEDSGIEVLLTQAGVFDRLPYLNQTPHICLDEGCNICRQSNLLSHQSQKLATENINKTYSKSLAYIIYTSGSTGNPKGVMVEHRAVTNLLLSMTIEPGLQLDDILLAVTTYSFDISVLEIFLPLIAGARCHLCDSETAMDAKKLKFLIAESGATIMQATPTTWSMLFYSGWRNTENIKILCGGEALLKSLKMDFIRTNSEAWNVYGPTETTIWSSIARIEATTPITIGTPIANTQMYIIDEKNKLVPIGVPGELCIAGAGLARGYLNRDDLTVEKFVENPFASGSLMYRTGDLVRRLENGQIEYLARIDSQVKIRGFRVELGEIEFQLQEHDFVQTCVVNDWKDAADERSLVAYIVLKENIEFKQGSEVEINYRAIFKEYLAAVLPAHLIPSAFIFLQSLPLTPNGKINRKALPVPSGHFADMQNFVAPRTALEESLVEIWSEVLSLEVEEISVNAGFFDLGGHSVLSMFLVNLINKRLAVDLDFRTVMDNPSIEKIAAIVSNDSSATAKKPISRLSEAEYVPLSFAQERLWFLSKLEGTSIHYNMPMALRFEGLTNKAGLIRSLELIISRHDVFRTRFIEVDDNVYQILDRKSHFKIAEEEISDEQELEILFREEAHREFDFYNDHLIRAQLIKQSKNDYTLFVTMHHIISDAMSIMVFYRELMYAFDAECNGRAILLEPVEIQYRDYAYWQRNQLTEQVINTQLEFWKETLTDLNTDLPIPTDRCRPAVKTYNGAKTSFSYSAEQLAKLKKLSEDQDSTMYMTLLAAFAILLNQQSHQSDITIGSPIANRNRSELESVIGLFVNTLIMRVKVDKNASFVDMLEQVKKVAISAYANQDIPFEALVDALNPDRNLSHSPLFQVMFNVTSEVNDLSNTNNEGFIFRDNNDQKQLSISVVNHKIQTVKFDLLFNIFESSQGINAEVEYNTDLFEAETIERLTGQYTRLLDIVGRAPNSVLNGQDLMCTEEQEKVLVEWNDTEYTFAQNETLHGLFAQQVKQRPEKIAVKTSDGEICYQDLYMRAKRIASELISNGISANELVGVVVEKGCQQVAAVMGVLFAGAAYLPVDTKWPSQRKEEVLRAGECRVVLSTRDLSAGKSWKSDVLIVNIDQLNMLSTTEMDEIVLPEVSATDLAYVIFTSGSTGKPKGVMIEHGAAVNTILDINNKFGINASDSVLALSLLSFDLSVFDIFGLLAAGGCVVFPDVDKNADPEAWLKTISSTGVTIWNSVPGMLQMLIDYIDPAEHGSVLDKIKLRMALLSGDWIPVALPDTAVAKLPGLFVVALGGATEASIWSNYYPIKQSMLNYKSVPYGKPLTNQRFYILDDELNLCPVGVRGNLFIAGVGLARGYWKDQSQTERQFIDCPKLHQRLYKTGDLGRWLNDGNIEFLGRNDEQVKVRGYRIELGEVEFQTLQHENVKANIVVVTKDKFGENRLVSYVVPAAPLDTININLLRMSIQQHLSKSLPSYMVPDILMFLESLPLSENGKVDRKNLPPPQESESELNHYIAPNTAIEKLLAIIWREMLGVENIGVRDSFFELGGNSILTVRLAKRLRKELGYEISLRDIFRNPNIEMLSLVIENNANASNLDKHYSEKNINSIRVDDTKNINDVTGPKQLSKAVIWRDGGDTPMFIAHSVIAYSSGYSQLVGALPEGIPVYGLQYTVEDFKHAGFVSMEDLASFHIETIKNIQPEGPYRLIGHSSGGLLAYEIAYQLLGDDQEVEFLGMIDTHFVENSQIEEEILSLDRSDLVTQGISTLLQVTNIEAKISDETWMRCYRPLVEMESFEEGLSKAFTSFSEAESAPFFGAPEIWIYEKLYRALYAIIGLYAPPPLPIAIHLYQADSSLKEKPLLGWSKDFSESWIKTTLNAKHTDIIVEPSVQSIASDICKAFKASTALIKPEITLLQNIRSGNLKNSLIFCIPGAGGSVSQFIPFTDVVRDNIAIYGIQHRGSSGDDGVPHSTLEAMAKSYTAEISTVAKKTPIQLIGHSLGAWIAFEIGCQLEALGLNVAPLIVMDPDPFFEKKDSSGMRNNLDILDELLEIFSASTEEKFSLSIQDLEGLAYKAQIGLLHKHLIKSGILPMDSENSSVENLWRIFASHSRIRYMPKVKFNNDVIILMSKDTWCANTNHIDMKSALKDSWSEFAKSVRIVEVPGNHITMLNLPNIKEAVEHIDSAW